MQNVIDLLDNEFAKHFACEPADLRSGRIVARRDDDALLRMVVTERGGIAGSGLAGTDVLADALQHRQTHEALSPGAQRELLSLLPGGNERWRLGHDVLLYCTEATFRPAGGADVVEVGAEEAEPEGQWVPDVAFAVTETGQQVSRAVLRDQGHAVFRAVGVRTEAGHRGHGYAKACVSAVTGWALQRGLVPLYNTQAPNAASLAVARAVGYRDYMQVLTAVAQK